MSYSIITGGVIGRDHMVVKFITTYESSDYHH